MDNLTHSLVGAALAEASPRDRYALATPTLILAANVPDVDVVSYLLAGEFAALAWRRGLTHGVPALLVWPFVVAGVMMGWDRWVRLRRRADAEPARFAPLLALAALGALTHPALDWLNSYGMRWWLPLHGGWSYGDAIFIIDPWLWLALGGAVFLARSRGRAALTAWAGLALLASLLVLGTGMVPASAKVAWVAALVLMALARWLRPLDADPPRRRRLARVALAGAGAYIVAMVGVAALVEREARAGATALGLAPVDIMTSPRPASLVDRHVVVTTATTYHRGDWRWGRTPRLALAGGGEVPIRRGPDDVLERARADPEVRRFLVWSRYPFFHADEAPDGWRVRIGDARYAGRGLGGLEVRVSR